MAELTTTQKELMRKLYDGYGLTKEDTFTHKHYTIITRQGIEKIIAGAGIKYDFDVVFANADNVFLKGVGRKRTGENTAVRIVTTASASSKTTQSGYLMEMAEKRFMSRVALKLEGLYQLGFFGEDEADDFSSNKKENKTVYAQKVEMKDDSSYERART